MITTEQKAGITKALEVADRLKRLLEDANVVQHQSTLDALLDDCDSLVVDLENLSSASWNNLPRNTPRPSTAPQASAAAACGAQPLTRNTPLFHV